MKFLDNIQITGGTLYMSDGSQLMKIDSCDLTCEPEEIDYIGNTEKHIHSLRNEITLECEINSGDLNKILEPFMTVKAPDTFDLKIPKVIQMRKHKKKRINKKWLKRYGYKQIYLTSKGWRLGANNGVGEFEFIKQNTN